MKASTLRKNRSPSSSILREELVSGRETREDIYRIHGAEAKQSHCGPSMARLRDLRKC